MHWLATTRTSPSCEPERPASTPSTGSRGSPPAGSPSSMSYRATGIDDRPALDGLLARVTAAEPDYRKRRRHRRVRSNPVPVVLAGMVAIYGGCALLASGRQRARSAVALVVLAAAAIALDRRERPVQGHPGRGADVARPGPVMTSGEVRQLQDDFVVLVRPSASSTRPSARSPSAGPAADGSSSWSSAWPTISSDLAGWSARSTTTSQLRGARRPRLAHPQPRAVRAVRASRGCWSVSARPPPPCRSRRDPAAGRRPDAPHARLTHRTARRHDAGAGPRARPRRSLLERRRRAGPRGREQAASPTASSSACSGSPRARSRGQVTGTWFRMVQPGGNTKTGPYMINANSPADGGQATLLAARARRGACAPAGTSREPTPGFDGGGNSVADAITQPTRFFGVRFSISTNQTDPQTKTKVAPPTVLERRQAHRRPVLVGGVVEPPGVQPGRAQAGVEHRSQGARARSRRRRSGTGCPEVPGGGAEVDGDAATAPPAPTTPRPAAFVLEWTSHIDGGPFNGFTGLWHLEGVFEPSGRPRASLARPIGTDGEHPEATAGGDRRGGRHQGHRGRHRARPRLVRGPTGPGDGVPRAQRRRQVDDPAGDPRHRPPHVGPGDHRRAALP